MKELNEVVKKVLGAKIIGITTYDCLPDVTEDMIECDAGSIYVFLDNGYVLEFHNSEFGYMEIKRINEIELDKEALKEILENVLGPLKDLLRD